MRPKEQQSSEKPEEWDGRSMRGRKKTLKKRQTETGMVVGG